MSEKFKQELKEVVEWEKASFERLLAKQNDEGDDVAAVHTEGMIDAYDNILIWIENM